MKYENQYLHCKPEDRIRTTFEPSLADVACLRSFDCKAGVLQTTLSILLSKLCHELRNYTISPGDWSAYQHAIVNCRIELDCDPKRSPVAVPATRVKHTRARKTPKGHDNGGNSSVAQPTEGPL
jgi:hypothetical protein